MTQLSIGVLVSIARAFTTALSRLAVPYMRHRSSTAYSVDANIWGLRIKVMLEE